MKRLILVLLLSALLLGCAGFLRTPAAGGSTGYACACGANRSGRSRRDAGIRHGFVRSDARTGRTDADAHAHTRADADTDAHARAA